MLAFGIQAMKEFSDFRRELSTYVKSLDGRTESTRRSRFQDLLRDYFDIRADELEASLNVGGHGSRILGRVDALAGNVIFEFKKQLTAGALDEARNQLLKYVRALSTAGDSRRYTLIATDGNSFQPFVWDGVSTTIEAFDRLVVFGEEGEKAYHWLDDWVASRINLQRAPPEARSVGEALGLESSVFLQSIGILRGEWSKLKRDHELSYDEWRRSIVQVYGSNLATEELFLRHTYITTVAKVLVYYTLRPDEARQKVRTDSAIREILGGADFRRFGVLNLSEKDFFAWLGEQPGGLQIIKGLLDACSSWDFHVIAEDLLRTLYQELIDPLARHDLGEFYTPLWVAQMVVEEALPKAGLSIIDPACGSGTFLVAAVLRKISQGETIDQILDEVVGIDIHPVAVVVARTSYLLALQPLLPHRTGRSGSFSIPVYLSDSIRPQKPGFRQALDVPGTKVECFSLEVPNPKGPATIVSVPWSLVRGPAAEPILDSMEQVVAAGTWGAVEAVATVALGNLSPKERLAHLTILHHAFDAICRLHRETPPRNQIQVFLIRNYFRPSVLAGRFDRVVGNPPWIVFNSLKDRGVQDSVRAAYEEERLLPIESLGALITQLDVSALFFVRAAKTYLKDGGRIRFLLPQPVFSGMQYSGFRSISRGLPFDHVWDLADVRPIFKSVQTCVVGATLGNYHRAMKDPIPCERISGNLPAKALSLVDAKPHLNFLQTELRPVTEAYVWAFPEQDVSLLEAGRSFYFDKVRNGATLFPYGLVLSDIEVDPQLGVAVDSPAIKSSLRGQRQPRKPWKGIDIKGSTEGRFLFEVATMSEIVPYGTLELPTAALPILPLPGGDGARAMDSPALRAEGFARLAEYFQKQEEIWNSHHVEGQKAGTGTLLQQIDFRNKLSNHPFGKGYFVVIPTSARVVLAAVLKQGPRDVHVGSTLVPVQGVVIDHGNNYFFTKSKSEANYLCAFLNSGPVNAVTKPETLRGRDTERNTYREPLALPIPQFNPGSPLHVELAALGEACASRVRELMRGELQTLVLKAHIPHAFGELRMKLKDAIAPNQAQIDLLATRILKDAASQAVATEDETIPQTPEDTSRSGRAALLSRAGPTIRLRSKSSLNERVRAKRRKKTRVIRKATKHRRASRSRGLYPETESLSDRV